MIENKCDLTKERLYYEYIELSKNRNIISEEYGLSAVKIGSLLQKYGIKRKSAPRHGLSKHPLNIVWCGMKERCTNPNAENYRWYGGRGIGVCKEWEDSFLSFYNWSMDNGWSKSKQLERIDNNKNYSPFNCCWITHKQQCRNRRSNISIEINGVSKLMCEWEEYLGLKRKILAKWKHRNGEDKMIEKLTGLVNAHQSN